MGARAYLALVAAAALLPLLVVAGYVFHLVLQSDRAAATTRLLEAARAIAHAIDQELASAETLLRVLAASPYLTGDLARFQQQAAAARSNEAVAIALYDAHGNALVHTDEPFGAVLDQHARPEQIAADLAGNEARIWIIERAQDRTRKVSLDVPWSTGEERYVVSQIRPALSFQTMLQQQVPQGWAVAVFDHDLIGIAHSGAGRDFAGKRAPEYVRAAVAQNPDGGISSLDGLDMYEAFARVPRSGWFVVLSAPAQALGSGAGQLLGMAALGALSAIMIAAVAAFVLGHRLSRSIGDAAVAASLLGRGQPLPPGRPSIKEIDSLRSTLEDMHAGLEREAEARARAEAERLQLFESEQSARQLAEQQNRAKDEFLAMLGHELRNPLSAISGAVALMKAPAAQEQHRVHAREVISRQVQHLSRVVDDLLDLSRVMTGKITLDLRPVDLAQAAATCLNSMRAAGRTGEHELKVALQPGVWISGDATRLEQIIGNLLSNAFKYTPPEGRIELEVSAEADDAVLCVRDTGLGIPKRLLPHVFDVFVQGDQSLERAKGGLGIGLALVQRLVRLHGGSVHADSGGDGRGSTFSVRLPRIAAPDAGAAATAADAPARRRLRVLVVDDHEDSRTMLRMLLEQAGHEAVEAVDGIDGVQIALSRRPDVAIVDIGLPGINGYEVARRLRQLPVSGRMALIALSGYGQDEDRRRALHSGFDRHLVKPVDAERLTEALLEVASAAVVQAAPHSAPRA